MVLMGNGPDVKVIFLGARAAAAAFEKRLLS